MHIMVTKEEIRSHDLLRDLTTEEIEQIKKGELDIFSMEILHNYQVNGAFATSTVIGQMKILKKPTVIHEEDIHATLYDDDKNEICEIRI